MANKKPKKAATAKRALAASKSTSNVTRISASDSKAPKVSSKPLKSATKPTVVHKATSEEKAAARTARGLRKSKDAPTEAEVNAQKAEKQRKRIGNPLASLVAYFRGAWYELRQVRWPDRANTWKMTGALLLFCAFFVILILLLDSAFGTMFEWIIG